MPSPRSASAARKGEEPPDPLLESEFDSLIGHDLILRLWSRLLGEGRLPQTILLAGVPLLGKRSMAVALAKRLLSEGAASPPPGAGEGGAADPREYLRPDPEISRRVARQACLDFLLLRPEKNSKIIRIDQVRALQEWAWISPSGGARKVAVILGADTISEEAANSFLKILEEPPPSLTLLLVSDAPHRLLETVRSRCAAFLFHPLGAGELCQWLEGAHGLSPRRARVIAGLSEGRPGRALEFLEAAESETRDLLLGEMRILLDTGFPALAGVTARCLKGAGGLRPALDGLLLLLREALAARIETEPPGAAESGPPAARNFCLAEDFREPLQITFGGLPAEALLAAAETVAEGLELTRHLYIPSEPLALQSVLARAGAALRRPGAAVKS